MLFTHIGVVCHLRVHHFHSMGVVQHLQMCSFCAHGCGLPSKDVCLPCMWVQLTIYMCIIFTRVRAVHHTGIYRCISCMHVGVVHHLRVHLFYGRGVYCNIHICFVRVHGCGLPFKGCVSIMHGAAVHHQQMCVFCTHGCGSSYMHLHVRLFCARGCRSPS